jgi:DmsE family decaheme c-type cytochrome
MNTLRKIAVLCMLVGGAWSVSSALAADLPDMGTAPQAQGTMSGTVSDRVNKDAVCTKCHDESEAKPVLSIAATKHGVKGDARTPSCQSCHGESDAHVKNVEGKATRPAPDVLFGMKSGKDSSFSRTEAAVQNQSCAQCHSNAGGKRNFWAGSQHQSRDVPCAACHEIHAKQDKVLAKATQPEVCFACHKDQRAQSKQISHHPIGEGKVVCSDCHNPHGSPGPKLLKKNTTNETCFLCHAEKRGPFLWEHQPATEDCANCHTPHGSNITPLLKSRPPFLCQECHNGPHNSKTPAGANVGGYQNGLPKPGQNASTQATARGCLNCHVMVHGSNHPAGAFFHR